MVINPKTFSIVPNLQTQEGVIICMPKSFPYKDGHRVFWKYDVFLISTRIGKEEVYSNISSGLSGLIRSGHYYIPNDLEKRRKEIGKGTVKLVRNRVTTKEAEEFMKVIRNLEYSVIQQLNKSPISISILALLLSFNVHYKALLKVLKETYVPTSATESAFEGMASTVLATNQISFTNDDLPPKGREYTFPMHIIVKCEDLIIARVLIDNGLALNVYSMSTLERLNVDTSLILPSTTITRDFDGTLRDVQGKIKLAIGVGPMSFMVDFQVIKVDSPYNMLIGKPWLHAVGAVASTLHRRLKFPFEDLLITIMAEEPLTFFKETFVPYIGANAFLEATFHSFELVSMISRALELESAWPSTTLMAAKEMPKFGYH